MAGVVEATGGGDRRLGEGGGFPWAKKMGEQRKCRVYIDLGSGLERKVRVWRERFVCFKFSSWVHSENGSGENV